MFAQCCRVCPCLPCPCLCAGVGLYPMSYDLICLLFPASMPIIPYLYTNYPLLLCPFFPRFLHPHPQVSDGLEENLRFCITHKSLNFFESWFFSGFVCEHITVTIARPAGDNCNKCCVHFQTSKHLVFTYLNEFTFDSENLHPPPPKKTCTKT